MDPISAFSYDVCSKVIQAMLKADYAGLPGPMLSLLLRQVLDLSVIISDELDRRTGL